MRSRLIEELVNEMAMQINITMIVDIGMIAYIGKSVVDIFVTT
jgi:hypothetical protein